MSGLVKGIQIQLAEANRLLVEARNTLESGDFTIEMIEKIDKYFKENS